jgi:tetratricopeptide (TPR) repeat protein
VTLGLIKKYQEALECFEEVLLKDPENPDALQFKRMTLELMGKYR